ncbi:branched-chain amino acid transport system substrate-binding protein [Amorphus sp. MBR-141]
MIRLKTLLAGAAALAFAATGAQAQDDQLKIGLVATFSGPAAAIGDSVRNGFMLFLKQHDGQIGGVPTEVVVVDDELKPDVGVTKVKALLERDEVDIVVGTVFSNIMMAIAKPVFDAETLLISPNAGPSPLAGPACSKYYFNVAYQNDANHAVLGKYAADQGYKRVIVLAPNYQAGKDGVAGFKQFYDGEIVDEIYTQLGQLDFSAELARIAAAKPDAVYTFMPGGMGVNLVKQWDQAGLKDKVAFLSAFTVDELSLPATQDAAVGLKSGQQWGRNFDNALTKTFVADYESAYGAPPPLYAAQAYDVAVVIDAAVKKAGGDFKDTDKLIEAIAAGGVDTLRGPLTFGKNHFPVQDYYLAEATKTDDGKYVMVTTEKVLEGYVDSYADQCKM